MIGVYHDEPETTSPNELHSDAAISVPQGVPLPDGRTELTLPTAATPAPRMWDLILVSRIPGRA